MINKWKQGERWARVSNVYHFFKFLFNICILIHDTCILFTTIFYIHVYYNLHADDYGIQNNNITLFFIYVQTLIH